MNGLHSRRDILKWGGAAGAIALARPVSLLAMPLQDKKHIPVGLQLYSVRDALKKDFEGT